MFGLAESGSTTGARSYVIAFGRGRVLELILRFLKYTAIPRDTFGRLTVNDPHLVWKLEKGMQLSNEAELTIISFMNHYEEAKS